MDKVKSYAKVNLGLEVVKKTKKGYHKLKMIMSQIDLYDEIIFEDNDSGIIVRTDKHVCDMEDNLCYKVAKYLQEKYKIQKGINIFINKKIPDGGGLGGGSSNAAAVIKYLNDYWHLKLSKRKMKRIGFLFGCDIPFFIDGELSYVSGYGERVKKIKNIKGNINSCEIFLIIPNFKNSTREVFEKVVIRNKNSSKINKLIKKIQKNDYISGVFNTLEEPANDVSDGKISKLISTIKKIGYQNVVMTGSGSTIVVYLEKAENNSKKEELLKKSLVECNIVKTNLKMYSY